MCLIRVDRGKYAMILPFPVEEFSTIGLKNYRNGRLEDVTYDDAP